MDELIITRSEAKTIIIAVINGGSTYKSKIVKMKYLNILKPFVDLLIIIIFLKNILRKI